MLPLLLSVAIAQVHKPTAVDIEFQHIEQARQELSKGGLSSKTRLMLEKDANSPRPDFSLAAISKLEWAVQLNRYPKPKLLKTIEKQAEVAPSWWGVNFAAEYGRTLGLKLAGDPGLDAAGRLLVDRRESPFTFTYEDRAFAVRCLSSKTVSGRLDALYAILPKKHLSKLDATWVRARLMSAKQGHSKAETGFWMFAERASRYRGSS